MFKDTAYVNKIVRRKEHERSMEHHLENIKNVRPLTKPIDGLDINLNNRKKEYQNQMRFTQIERQNRILLEKISTIMNKTKRGSFLDRNNKSLNSTFRRRQNQDIQIQNARLLKRLQDKKPNYETEKLNKQWVRQKNVMKIMSNYPFMLSDRPKQKRNSTSQMEKQKRSQLMQPIEIVRMRVINGFNFLITVQLSSRMLKITGDCKERKEVKVIEIERNEAIEFIQQQCHSKLQQIFGHLRYDSDDGILYLIGNQVQLQELIQKERNSHEIRKQDIEQNQEQEQEEVYDKQRESNQQAQKKQNIQQNPEKERHPSKQNKPHQQV